MKKKNRNSLNEFFAMYFSFLFLIFLTMHTVIGQELTSDSTKRFSKDSTIANTRYRVTFVQYIETVKYYYLSDTLGNILEEGMMIGKNKVGTWVNYFTDGSIKSIGKYSSRGTFLSKEKIRTETTDDRNETTIKVTEVPGFNKFWDDTSDGKNWGLVNYEPEIEITNPYEDHEGWWYFFLDYHKVSYKTLFKNGIPITTTIFQGDSTHRWKVSDGWED